MRTIEIGDFVEFIDPLYIKRGFVLSVKPPYAHVQYFSKTSKYTGAIHFYDRREFDLLHQLKIVPDIEEDEDVYTMQLAAVDTKDKDWFEELGKRRGECEIKHCE